jgi:hypothetical protein
VELHNIGMVQGGDQLGLTLETREKMGIVSQIRVEQLDGHGALEMGVKGLPDFGHSALPQWLLQFIFPEAFSCCIHGEFPLFLQQ